MYALGPKTTRHPNGEPYIIGQTLSLPLIYKCYRCTVSTRIDAEHLNILPELTEAELSDLGF